MYASDTFVMALGWAPHVQHTVPSNPKVKMTNIFSFVDKIENSTISRTRLLKVISEQVACTVPVHYTAPLQKFAHSHGGELDPSNTWYVGPT